MNKLVVVDASRKEERADEKKIKNNNGKRRKKYNNSLVKAQKHEAIIFDLDEMSSEYSFGRVARLNGF